MKFTLSWLKEHLETTASLDEITDALTRVGLEVESVEDKAKALAPFTIAYVVSAVQHPNADRLRVCMVDTGSGEPVQVVCGAPNARTGMKSVFSPPAPTFPARTSRSARAPSAASSRTACCARPPSCRAPRIMTASSSCPPMRPSASPMPNAGLSDPVIEIAMTPNRPDALGVAGMARDLAAAGLGTLKTPSVAPVAAASPAR
jgi:phenylalanyl-tRNA synthetase beta chain